MVFDNPFELLVYYDQNFLDEIHRLYPWQIEILKTFSADRPLDEMIRMAIIAANGSGKSQFILAPCSVWLNVAFENALSYVTSSSASQLDTQTERFIDSFTAKMDKFHYETSGVKVWDNIKRKKRFLPNESFIDLFATDEPKRAEGKHPLVPGAEFGIFVDEGKSIASDIYGAIDRCTGATRRLDISSAGGCHGHFYEVCTKPELGWWTRKITYSDCPHISQGEFNQQVKKHGIHDPLVRSIFFSEFTDIEDAIVMRRETVEYCMDGKRKLEPIMFTERRAGLDLSGGGDEMVLSIWEGNLMLGQETARFKDVGMGVAEIIHWVGKWKIEHNNVWVEFDGFNRGIVAMLDDKGYSFNRVLSGGKAIDSKRYANRITELWFNFKRYVEEGYVSIMPDLQLKSQLCNRYYRRQSGSDRIILERKEEARKKGHPSPDRADALVFAWAGCPTIEDFQEQHIAKNKPKEPKYGLRVKESDLMRVTDDWAYGEKTFFYERRLGGGKGRINNSLSCAKNADDMNEEGFVNNSLAHINLDNL